MLERMKRNHKISLIAAALMAGIVSCKKDFLEEKRDLGGVNEEVYKDSILATAYVDYVYGLFLPPDNAQSLSWNIATNDIKFAQTTEEFPTQTSWNQTWASISYVNGHALNYFGAPLESSVKNNTWTRIRECNLFLDNIDNYGLPEEVRKRLKGQIYFWRAYQYFDLVRLYGGVPLVLQAQDPINAQGNESLKVPRSSTTDTYNQVYSDLDSAIALLPGRWLIDGNAQWGRITKGGAMAFKGRVALTHASPLFNRSENTTLWQKAYDINKAARDYLITQGFGLYKTGNLSNGTAFENMFSAEVNSKDINPEAVIVFSFNTVTADQVKKNNGWENAARPKEINGGGSLNPTRQMLDAFPMKDGKMPGVSTDYKYVDTFFYKNRDPRFYKTFAINGQLWPYAGNSSYRLWSYKWFANTNETLPSRTTETKGANSTGIYVRKGTAANASNTTNGNFATNGNDFLELRFAEVLLSLAEAAAATGRESEAIQLLGQIRERAGIENKDGLYGLAGVSGRDATIAAVLNERKLELAYEGKRFWDLRRWMLFNNDFGTCDRMGVTPLNGTRRTGIAIAVFKDKTAGTRYVGTASQDPLFLPQGTVATLIRDREPASLTGGITQDQYVDTLYKYYFKVVEKDDVDPTTNNWKFRWYNEYYFFGLNSAIIQNSPYLEQTKGWDGLYGMGTFDPLK
jgi:hypothetical protein